MPKETRERLLRSLSDKNAAKLATAKVNQVKLNQLYNAAAVPGATKPGFGPLQMVIDPYLAQYFSRTCEAREMVWEDPEFSRWLLKNGPEFRVREAPTKVQVGHR
jgi:hypothetical protein